MPTTQPSWALDRALGARLGLLGVQAGAGRGRWGARQRAAGARTHNGRAGAHDRRKQPRGSRLERTGRQVAAARRRGARAAGSGARGVRGVRSRGAAWALGARPGSWACGLALGCALGALGLFSIRFDSFFFPESLNEHCSL